ncbi:hypothetical protein CEUSTIGMA_g6544.t1 [Chlamydomonas eustigma]|uniref:Pirin N-terminal domain-containing protein n=1 Tax=Chlamydomonas eustigma TaxID=1157962 RepID=A0A250X7P1_9CHLO|nr:hypothetical protein CEUSTIGMA_g6544.t1 [Chlamydomonas eustigma]|eukprot:GAX79104.1 hypothetical protein CEUSTIGMA_g6544.t1 [Chlamydomonas eustigma]
MSTQIVRRSVENVVTLTKKVINPGFSAYRINSDAVRKFDPFLNCDWFEMSQPTFPPHPHAGFSAISHLFEDSEGSFTNRDSKGDSSVICPGDTHWTCAASGIIHEEIPKEPGVMGKGLQIFLNLASQHKQTPPAAFKLHSKEVPVYTSPTGASVRVIAGGTQGVVSPLNDSLLTKVTLLDIKLPPGSSFTHALPAEHNAVALIINGSASFGSNSAVVIRQESVCEFGNDGDVIEMSSAFGENSPGTIQVYLFSGLPLNEPIIWMGPFCGNSEEQVK